MVWVMLKKWQPMNDNRRFYTLPIAGRGFVSEIPYGHVPAIVPLVNLFCMATVHYGQVLPLVPACGPSQKWKGSWGGGTFLGLNNTVYYAIMLHSYDTRFKEFTASHIIILYKVFHHVLCHTIQCTLWLKGEPQEQRYAKESGAIWSYGWRDNCWYGGGEPNASQLVT